MSVSLSILSVTAAWLSLKDIEKDQIMLISKGPNRRKQPLPLSVSPLTQDQKGISHDDDVCGGRSLKYLQVKTFQSGSSAMSKLTLGYSPPPRRPDLTS